MKKLRTFIDIGIIFGLLTVIWFLELFSKEKIQW